MRTRMILAALAIVLAVPASAQAETLVVPSGQPVSGQWQALANSARVPSYTGNVVLIVDGTMQTAVGEWRCAACSSAPGSLIADNGRLAAPYAGTVPTTYVGSSIEAWSFYWEMGHQFDWNVLTDAERSQFAALWGTSVQWWDTAVALDHGVEDGLEAQFAGVYANCADPSLQQVYSFSQVSLTPAQQAASCALIDRIGGWAVPATIHHKGHRRHRRHHRHTTTTTTGSSRGVV